MTEPTIPGPDVDTGEQPAQGARTLREVIDELEAQGYGSEFRPTDDGRLQCLACREVLAPDRLHPDRIERLEGASDPADLEAIAAMPCPACGEKGLVVLAYGPNADDASAEVLAHLG